MSSTTVGKRKWYVTMTDRFMSGWGRAKGLTNKYIVGCDDYGQAQVIAEKASRRSEMKYINITSRKPYYGRGYLVSYVGFEDIGWQ